MTDTLKNIPLVRNQWVNLYAQSGIPVGTQIIAENLTDTPGKLYAGANPPVDADENDGYFSRLMQYSKSMNDSGDDGLWALCESDGVFVNVKVAATPLIDVNGQGTNYIDKKILAGDYFSGFFQKVYTAPETAYRVIKTGSAPLFIESVDVEVDYSSITGGEFTFVVRAFVDISNSSTWSYTGGTPIPAGKPLNVALINKMPVSEWVVDPVVSNLTGTADFILLYNQYFRESSGNRDSVSGVDNNFFSDGRKLIIPPNSEVLIEVEASGGAGNTAGVLTYVNFVEPGEY